MLFFGQNVHSGQLTWLAGNWTRIEDVFPIEHGDIPACYVNLPEGMVGFWFVFGDIYWIT